MLYTKFPTMFHNAESGAGGGAEHQETPADEIKDNTGGNPENKAPDGGAGEGNPADGGEKLLTQDEVNAIVQKRLAEDRERREKRKAEEADEAERKRLEEQQEYQKLADKYKAELDAIRAEATETKKVAALVKAGYSDEQVERYKKFVDGETDEAIEDAVKALVADVPPKKKEYADPSLGNGGKPKPTPKDKASKGREAFQRLKNAGKLR